jgi:hypothetical protein
MSRCFSVYFLCIWVLPAEGALYTLPRAAVGVEGNSFSFIPLSSNATSIRFQQVFAASQFAVFDQGVYIEGILFRADTSFGSLGDFTLRDVQVNLSTSQRTPDNLSGTFAQNIGSDETIAFDRGSVTLDSTCCIPGGPQLFSMVIPFSRPFLYQPTAGNLLLDVRNYGGIFPPLGALDAILTPGDSISSAWASDPTAPTADQTSSLGLAVALALTPVPEPSSVALLLAGLLLFGLHFRQRKRHSRHRTQ